MGLKHWEFWNHLWIFPRIAESQSLKAYVKTLQQMAGFQNTFLFSEHLLFCHVTPNWVICYPFLLIH